MKFTLVLIMLFSSACFAWENPKEISSKELFNSSDVVAILKIIKGELVANNTYQVTGRIEKKFKGDVKSSELAFEHIGFFSDEPNKLGGTYLVYLKQNKKGYMSNKLGYSVIEIDKIASDRDDIKLAFSKLNLQQQWVKEAADGFFWYPVVCTYSSEKLCAKVFNSLDDALK